MTCLKPTFPTGRRRAAAVIPPLFAKAYCAAKNCHARKKIILASGVIAPTLFLFAEFKIKPIARQAPFAHYFPRRYVERFGRLFHAQPAEEPQLDHPALARIDLRQTLERIIQGDEVRASLLRHHRGFLQRDLLFVPAPALPQHALPFFPRRARPGGARGRNPPGYAASTELRRRRNGRGFATALAANPPTAHRLH